MSICFSILLSQVQKCDAKIPSFDWHLRGKILRLLIDIVVNYMEKRAFETKCHLTPRDGNRREIIDVTNE